MIEKLEILLLNEHIYKKNSDEQEIIDLTSKILGYSFNSFNQYRENIISLTKIFDKTENTSIGYLIELFSKNYDFITKSIVFEELSPFNSEQELNSVSQKIIFKKFEDALKFNESIRLSQFKVDLSELSKNQKIGFLRVAIKIIQDKAENLVWTKDEIQNITIVLAIARNAAEQSDNLDLYYLTSGNFINRLNTSEHFQLARDYTEEFIVSSYAHNYPFYGFYLAFKNYSYQKNALQGLIYANLCFTSIKKECNKVNEKLVKELIWETIKFFRNIDLISFAKLFYLKIPKTIKFEDFEYRAMKHTYLIALLKEFHKELPSIVSDTLSLYREDIFQNDVSECAPWLILLYNIKKTYPENEYRIHMLDYYENILQSIVPVNSIQKIKDIVLEDGETLKKHFKDSLLKLTETRYKSDFTYDVDFILMIGNRLIRYGFEEKDFEAFLLAMIVKSDYSLVFADKEDLEITQVNKTTGDIQLYADIYKNLRRTKDELKQFLLDKAIVWLALSGDYVYEMQLFNQYEIFKLDNWEYEVQNKWQKEQYKNLLFEDTIKQGNVRDKFPEDYLIESQVIKNNLSFAKINIENSNEILLIKDIALSEFPHNLILDNDSNFVFLSKPITNILSTEWLINRSKETILKNPYSKAIWIPIKRGDFTLNHLYSKLEQILVLNNFEIYDDVYLHKPISSDINILTAHGSTDISSFHALFTNDDESIFNIHKIIGNGKILILFVCHSGSMTSGLFQNKIQSMVRYFLENGYESVIAPFWALHISIPPIWLPIFLKNFNEGYNISKAFHFANLEVYKYYSTPSAWACLHLYGNPIVRIESTN